MQFLRNGNYPIMITLWVQKSHPQNLMRNGTQLLEKRLNSAVKHGGCVGSKLWTFSHFLELGLDSFSHAVGIEQE